MSEVFDGLAGRLADGVQKARTLPDAERDRELARLLRVEVHDPVMRLAADAGQFPGRELAALAALVRDLVPEGIEDRLPVRQQVFVRLLRYSAAEPAWTLAQDNASGVVSPSRAVSRWGLGSFLRGALPTSMLTEEGHVFAWLPGFRDPRFGVPDDVYDVTSGALVGGRLQGVRFADGRLQLGGSAFLRSLTARADDEITLVFSGSDGAERRVRASRVRSPEHVRPRGPELTRLAWAGWRAEVDLADLAMPGRWRVAIEVAQNDLRRAEPLGVRRGAVAAAMRQSRPREAAGCWLALESENNGAMVIRVQRLGLSARILPRSVRALLRWAASRRRFARG